MRLIDTYIDQIKIVCGIYNVKSLYSVGSVNTSKFTQESDLELLVDFETTDPIEYTENYFDLKFKLEAILNRPIDLLENKAIKNPFFIENIEKSKILIYGK